MKAVKEDCGNMRRREGQQSTVVFLGPESTFQNLGLESRS